MCLQCLMCLFPRLPLWFVMSEAALSDSEWDIVELQSFAFATKRRAV